MARQYTIITAGEAVGCNKETIRRAIKRGELRATQHPTAAGRPLLIDAGDLAAWIERRKRVELKPA